MQVNRPSGISAVTFFRLLPVAPTTRSVLPFCGGRRKSGIAISRAPERYWPVSEFGLAMMSAGRALGDDLAAMDAGGRADVDDVVGLADRVLVVLDDDHGVAEVAQVLERVEQAGVVALVQADRGLVEDVEHAGQPRADLRGEADALALAAGERAGGAGEGEVVEADIDQEFQALADLLEDARRRSRSAAAVSVAGRSANQAIGLADRHAPRPAPMCRPASFTASASGFRR